MLKIRLIESFEMGRVARFMKQFERETKFVTVDVEYATNRYIEMIDSGLVNVFVAEKDDTLLGALGFMKAPDLHNGEMIAVETFWFVAPEHRGIGVHLLNAFEKWAEENECDKTAMVHLEDSMPKSLEKFYLKRGYYLAERHYLRWVTR